MYGSTATTEEQRRQHEDSLIATWAAELGPYSGEDLRVALEAMRFAYKDYPPTLFQFASLCRDARQSRAQRTQRLPAPRRDARNIEMLGEIHALTRRMLTGDKDPRDWARRILKREQQGEPVAPIALVHARAALGIA